MKIRVRESSMKDKGERKRERQGENMENGGG